MDDLAMMDEPLTFHPIADIFPLMEGTEYETLKADIGANGLQVPIWLHEDGRIIDGRNRYRACRETGAEITVQVWDGDPDDDAALLAFIISLNLHRRHLSDSQRAMIAARIANLKRGRPTENGPIGPFSQQQASELLNVASRSVKRAATVHRNGTPGLNHMVETGEVKVSAAASVATLPIEEQETIVAAGPTAVREAAREIREGVDDPEPADDEGEPEPIRAPSPSAVPFLITDNRPLFPSRPGERCDPSVWTNKVLGLDSLLKWVHNSGGIAGSVQGWTASERETLATQLEFFMRKLNDAYPAWVDYLRSKA